MGEAADQKMKEIEETRDRLEVDLRELEERMPSPVRSAKKVAGMVAGSSVLLGLLARRRRKSKREKEERDRKTEVVVRVVRDDERG